MVISIGWSPIKFQDDLQLRFFGLINGKDVEMVIDTGASSSVISEEIVRNLNIKYEETNIKIRVADGNVVKPIGLTEEIQVIVV